MHNKRAIGLLMLMLGFVFSLFGLFGLMASVLFWVIGTLLFAKSYLE